MDPRRWEGYTGAESAKGPPERVVMGGLMLSFDRTWSVPSGDVPDELVIANVLARPTLDDLTTVCMRYGCARVRDLLGLTERNDEIGRYARVAARRMLGNIEAGLEHRGGAGSCDCSMTF